MDEHSQKTKDQLAQALKTLQTKLSDFIAAVTQATAIVELDQGQQGRLSRIDAMQAQKMAQAEKRRAEVRLDRVTHILTQTNEEDFGCCGECGESIPIPRLRAMPDAVLCVDCATQRER